MITLQGVSKIFSQPGQDVRALDDVSLHVKRGEVFGVVGASGAGKSTLIRCVNLLERPTSGSVTVDGQELTVLNETALRAARQHIGMIFQHFNLLSSRTVTGNILFPLEITKYDPSKRQARVEELLDLVGLSDKADAYPSQLSGGQKQRVAIARALATEPRVLLSDEATSALDPQTTESILSLLKDLNERLGLTILLITHEMGVIKKICDHVAVLEDGKVVEAGAITDLIVNPESRLSEAFFPPVEKIKVTPGVTQASVTFIGEAADDPVLTNVVRNFDVDVNILGGSIQNIAGKRIGRLQVELSGTQVQLAIEYMRRIGLRVEVN